MIRISNTIRWSMKYAKAIELTPELQQILDQVLNDIKYETTNYTEGFELFTFENHYTKRREFIYLEIDILDGEDIIGGSHYVTLASDSLEYGELIETGALKEDDILHIITIEASEDVLIEDLESIKETLTHELIHALDPKNSPEQAQPYKSNTSQDYYQNNSEFDAWSRNLIDTILDTPHSHSLVKTWMKDPSTYELLCFAMPQMKIYQQWNPQQQRTFLQRLYHAMQNIPQEPENVVGTDFTNGV